MPRKQPDPNETTPTPALAETRPPRIGLEVAVVLMIGIVPHLASSLFYLLASTPPIDPASAAQPPQVSFAVESISHIAQSLSIAAAVLWIMRQSREPWNTFGFVRPKPLRDSGLGIGIFALNWLAWFPISTAVASVLWAAGITWNDANLFESGVLTRPTSPLDFPMLLVMSVANATSEQVVITAYLISRFTTLFRSAVPAVIVATTLFASYHMYQGIWGVFGAALFGGVIGTYFAITRNIWPCLVAHILGDVVPYTIAYLD